MSVKELAGIVRYGGFRKLARQHWKTGLGETRGSLRAFTAAAQRYVPELTVADLVPSTAGIRAQALETDGSLVDDFRISRRGAVVAVRNAPSPEATSSLAIAEHIVDNLLGRAARSCDAVTAGLEPVPAVPAGTPAAVRLGGYAARTVCSAGGEVLVTGRPTPLIPAREVAMPSLSHWISGARRT